MLTPPSDLTDGYQGQSGFWFELRDANDRVLYRRILHNPIRSHIEAPSGDPARPFMQVRKPQTKGIFELLAPELAGARTLVIFASPPADPGAPASQVARLSLAQ
jgi:hypothetical protein